ncbi:hypothetical protein GOODEAATRI_021809 [Goodea atripinnis]|uniref:Uncharacterized protein n=1 Tax=Goodea atripinnis TaxID=208336 RepID=A0ABV0PZZ6_9TELE
MSQDQQLRVAVEEVVNTFSPALSLDLLLYNVLGSNTDIAMCLVHFLIRSYSTNQAWSAHTKTTLRNMIRWSVLTGFTLCIFLPWAEIRSLTLMPGTAPEKESAPATRSRVDDSSEGGSGMGLGTSFDTQAQAFRTLWQEREAHESALALLMDVPTDRLVDTLQLLMIKSCEAHGYMAFDDTETDLVTCAVDGVLYRHISSWEAGCVQGVFFASQKSILVSEELGLNLPRDHGGTDHGLSRQVNTSTSVDCSSLACLPDLMLSSRGQHQWAGLSVTGNAVGKPLLGNLSHFLVSEQQPDMFGLNTFELPTSSCGRGSGAHSPSTNLPAFRTV